MVIAFEKLQTEEEANLFVTINHEQKSVPRSLLDDLEGDLKWGSSKPAERIGAIGTYCNYKQIHFIVVLLHS